MTETRLPAAIPAQACSVIGPCDLDAGCGCRPSPATKSFPGVKAMMLGVLCVLGCLAGPLLIGGVAASGSAIAGEAWIAIVGAVVAVTVGIVFKRRGRGSIC